MSCHWIFYRNYSILHLGAGLPFSYLPYIDFGGVFFLSLFCSSCFSCCLVNPKDGRLRPATIMTSEQQPPSPPTASQKRHAFSWFTDANYLSM